MSGPSPTRDCFVAALLRRARHALASASPRVILLRGWQELAMSARHAVGGWARLERQTSARWTAERARAYRAARTVPRLLAPDAPEALRGVAAGVPGLREAIVDRARRYAARDFAVFGCPVPREGPMPWRTDWRWATTWEPAFFRQYDHFRPREQPYDVKLPWEVSRLWFVLPILQGAAFEPRLARDAIAFVADWERDNPLAYTVNWCAMEAAMRGISLVLALEMLLVLGDDDDESLRLLLRQLAIHGEFVWRAVEYTDVRGNHYATDVAALLLIGLALEGSHPAARRWIRYARRSLERELREQFAPDGTHREKCVAYQRLVTEEFLLAALAAERAGLPVSEEARDRLVASCEWLADCVRPDGLSANLGDNDSARILVFDDLALRDHRALLGVGAARWSHPGLRASCVPRDAGGVRREGAPGGLAPPLAAAWLLGEAGISRWEVLEAAPPEPLRVRREGGLISCRGRAGLLLVDTDTVGDATPSSHSHWDMLGFDLVLSDVPVLVDPGCATYSANMERRVAYQSAAMHNSLLVDGAPVDAAARASLVEGRRERGFLVAVVGHDGFSRHGRLLTHERELALAEDGASFACTERFQGSGAYRVERRLHCDAGASLTLEAGGATLESHGQRFALSWDEGTSATREEGWVSAGYGEEALGPVLVLRDACVGDATLEFRCEARTR